MLNAQSDKMDIRFSQVFSRPMFHIWTHSLKSLQYIAVTLSYVNFLQPVPVAARSEALVCGRSPAKIVSSNPTGGMDVGSVVSVVCCQVKVSATSCSLVQRSPTACGVPLCVI